MMNREPQKIVRILSILFTNHRHSGIVNNIMVSMSPYFRRGFSLHFRREKLALSCREFVEFCRKLRLSCREFALSCCKFCFCRDTHGPP